MVVVEKSFPRGGVVSKEAKEDVKDTNLIFGATQLKLKKHKPSKPKERTTKTSEDVEEQLKTVSAELLNYDTIQDGMNVMGIVESVDQLYVSISLPGRMTARASALEISDAYTKITQEFLQHADKATDAFKPLQDLISVGQIVYARVQEIKQGKNGRKYINMSLKPSEVHADLHHTNIKKGFIFNGAIEEIQEHGYIIESGIRGLRTFVPLEKSQPGHVVGQHIYLKVDKITHDKSASTSICKEVSPENLKIKSQNDTNIDYILPTSIVKFNIVKQLKDGLQGTIMNEMFTAYINEHQLAEALALPEDYEINTQVNARVLYVMPLTKLVYLTLNLRTKSDGNEQEATTEAVEQFKPGDIIENARVHHMGTGGIILVLNNKFKGVLSHKTIKANYKGNYDQDALLLKYAKKTKHKVRILHYDVMDSLYICTDDANIVNQKIFALSDLQSGDFVTATVKKRDTLIGGYLLSIGKIKAIIEKLYLAPNAKNFEENAKVRCRVIAVNQERNVVYLTNRQEYLSKTCKLLTSLSDAKPNSIFTGTVVKSEEHYVLVKFFNNLKGVLQKQQLSGYMATESESFYEGQTIKFRVESKSDEQIKLTLPEDTFSLGEICPIEVVNTLDSGLEIKISFPGEEKDGEIEMEEFKGLVPTRLLSDFVDLLMAKQRVLSSQVETEAVCIVKNIFSVRDVEHFRNNLTTEWNKVKTGDVLRAYIKSVQNDIIVLFVPIRHYNKLVKVHLKMLFVNAIRGAKIELAPEQVVYVKVLSMEPATKTVTVSAKLTDVWNGELSNTANFVESYLEEVNSIKKSLKKLGDPIAKYSIGDKITVEFQGINPETNDWLYAVEKTKVVAVLKPTFFGKSKPPSIGEKQQCIVLWIDYSNELLLISNKSFDIAHISKEKSLAQNLVGKTGINAKVLLKLENIVICSLKKGENPLVYCPIRLHYNDFEQTCSNSLKEGEFFKLTFIHENLPIAVPESIWKLWKNIKRKSEEELIVIKQKKAKLEQRRAARAAKAEAETEVEEKILLDSKESINEKVNIIDSKEGRVVKRPVELKTVATPKANKKAKVAKVVEAPLSETGTLFFEDKAPEKQPIEKQEKKEKPKYLPGISDFWNTDLTQLNGASNLVESSDDEGSGDDVPLKKKRLSTTEKFKQQREEEARLRAIEEKNADPNHIPETADQFDRLVLGGPNNSKNWINYMVFHMQSAEIEKAREVARRALKTISFRESNELLNVWVALLNLELRYGSKESFDEVLKEALVRNEPLTIYLRVLDIYIDAKKTTELIDVIGILTRKFRGEAEVWRAAANAYFAIEMTERGQQLMHRALTCLPEREHVNTIVAFANLNHKYGNNEMAQTLLDQVVTSYPKRVDVWTQYVDMLVKAQLIESARSVLERAVMQKIPLKKMRTIFKKYLEFEERFGNEENVQKVKQLATEFVKSSTTL